MTKIVQQGDPVLRGMTKEVPIRQIASKEIQKVLVDMKKALHATKDGVAIAAPQIGVPLSIFIVAGKVFDIQEDIYDDTKKAVNADQVYINPVITKLSRDKTEMEDGCLSVRYVYGKIKRSKKATVTAHDDQGKKFTRGAAGLLAQVFQHETDHLKGILFVDKAYDLKELRRGNTQ